MPQKIHDCVVNRLTNNRCYELAVLYLSFETSELSDMPPDMERCNCGQWTAEKAAGAVQD